MVQEFSLRSPLVDGQGTFGSMDGDSAAAMRYTEVRLAKIASELLSDLDKETVETAPNYDGSRAEPPVPPVRPRGGAAWVPQSQWERTAPCAGLHREDEERGPGVDRDHRDPLPGEKGAPSGEDRGAGPGPADRGDLRPARRVRTGRDAGGGSDEKRAT